MTKPDFDFAHLVPFRGETVSVQGFLNTLDIDCEEEDVADIHTITRADGTEIDLDSLEDEEFEALENAVHDIISNLP